LTNMKSLSSETRHGFPVLLAQKITQAQQWTMRGGKSIR
jgi:hypothetical protein